MKSLVTTNSGYPLDQNLYQAVKGMSAAARIVRKGGTIIIASEAGEEARVAVLPQGPLTIPYLG